MARTTEKEMKATERQEIAAPLKHLQHQIKVAGNAVIQALHAARLQPQTYNFLATRVSQLSESLHTVLELDRLCICSQCNDVFPAERLLAENVNRFCGTDCKNAFYHGDEPPKPVPAPAPAPAEAEAEAEEPPLAHVVVSAQQVQQLLKQNGPMTQTAIVQALHADREVVRSLLRDNKMFKRVGSGRWKTLED